MDPRPLFNFFVTRVAHLMIQNALAMSDLVRPDPRVPVRTQCHLMAKRLELNFIVINRVPESSMDPMDCNIGGGQAEAAQISMYVAFELLLLSPGR
jgi:hypothetical protein